MVEEAEEATFNNVVTYIKWIIFFVVVVTGLYFLFKQIGVSILG